MLAQAFIPNPNNKPEINHIDTNKENNIFSNLEWVTVDEHHKISKQNKQHTKIKGVEHANSLLNNEKVFKIRTLYTTSKYRYTDLAKMFNVTKSTIKDVICRINETHPFAKLSSFDILEIRTMYDEENMSMRKIAKRYNVSKETIRKIIRKLTWNNL